jgi:CheY-like chemotaxis protein
MMHVRKSVIDALLTTGLAAEVEGFADGAAFVKAVKANASQGPRFALAILDINMPILDGLKAALFLRKFEQHYGWQPTPILMFSSLTYDERMAEQLVQLRPAFYFNKAKITSSEDLPVRLESVLRSLKNRIG